MASHGVLQNGLVRMPGVDLRFNNDNNYLQHWPEVAEPPNKKRSRQKKTVPKHQELPEEHCNGIDIDMEAAAAFPLELEAMNPRRNCETPDNSFRSEEDEEEEESLDVQDFRRFSSRTRKRTNFFGVPDKRHTGGNVGRRGGRRRRVSSAKRMLRFDSAADILMIKPTQEEDRRQLSHVVQQEKIPPLSQEDQQEEQKPERMNQDGEHLSQKPQEDSERLFPIGTMIWGKLLGYDWWPGCVISHDEAGGKGKKETEESLSVEEESRSAGPQFWIKWFGDNQLSQISIDRLVGFGEFKVYFKPMHLKGIYKRGVLAALKEAAKRCKMEFLSRPDDKKLRWMVTESCPIPKLIDEKTDIQSVAEEESGSKVIAEASGLKVVTEVKLDPESKRGEEMESVESPRGTSPENRRGQKHHGKKERGTVLLTSIDQEMIDWAMNGFLPAGPEGLLPTEEQQIPVQVVPVGVSEGVRAGVGDAREGEEPLRKRQKMMLLQVRRKARFDSVLEGKVAITDLCIGCGDLSLVAEHPLFEGGLCVVCKESFMECAYLFDEDGTQMYCTICSGGDEVFMCDAENCAKVYCGPCIEKLCGAEELEKVKASDQWLCFMCSPDCNKVGLLAKRDDWVHKLRELFLNDNEMEYDPLPFYPPLPPEERRPIRVLGLFDGIATGLLVLKELGIEVATYVSSEIDMDAVYVSRVEHKEIIHVGDIERITEKEVKAWGPFDLVMGGSPCNDLSIVNPARKGIYEGTGRLFFEFFRVLSYTRPAPNEDRPFFWLFENVVSMRAADKRTISRFLQCNPVVIDAKEISAAHRARYFWGNLPGMNRPTIPRPGDRLTLQECLEANCFRHAQFTKLRTITTKMNSIKQTKKAIYPVKVEGQGEDEGDVLWCTEMERLFGFPDHYTDVGNLGRCGRQRLLGKAWSVPVIRHLLSPLKDYFKSSTTRETTNHCNTGI